MELASVADTLHMIAELESFVEDSDMLNNFLDHQSSMGFLCSKS